MGNREFRSRALALLAALWIGCGSRAEPKNEGAAPLSRTEFTERIENYFEYDPLRAGESSRFRIHLTDLAEGTGVAQAQVSLKLLSGTKTLAEAQARPGKAAGIYLGELTPSSAGTVDLEFRVRNEVLDETMRVPALAVE